MAAQRNRVGKAFGESLREARVKLGMTQEVLAEAADYKDGYISMLESGQRQPTITTLIAIEQALGLEAGELTRRTFTRLRGKLTA